jgi:hypothetical protein
MLDRPEEVREALSGHMAPWTGLITDYIRMGQESGRIREDVDPESYLTQVITMAIGTVALGNVTRSMFHTDRANIPDQLSEMIRMARVSLFKSRPQQESADE